MIFKKENKPIETVFKREAGFTLLEVVILACILGVVVLAIVPISIFAPRQSMALRDKSFATEKAMQMMEELRSIVVTSNKTYVLEEYDDGAGYSPFLTVNKNISDPADPLSGNSKIGGQWKYCRQISVINIPNNPGAKKVYVRVFKANDALPVQPQKSLVDLISVMRVVEKTSPPTQVFDVYLIAIENVPGWWTDLNSMKPMMDSIINDLQARAPGLEVRSHWIRKMATGRDPYYAPYINMTEYSSEPSAVEKVYFYPGLIDEDVYNYNSDLIAGRRCVDGASPIGSYSLADQYNNAVRFPEEGPSSGGEPSLRTLLEDMNSHPEKYMNAICVNLHGELLPFPPLRNYSDAAKDPHNHPDWRLVVHPTKLQYDLTEKINLRVYTYVMNPDSVAATTMMPVSTIYFPGAIVTVEEIEKLTGSDTVNYAWGTATSPGDYEITTYNDGVSDGTLIKLKNSPLRHPWKNASPKGGLRESSRLYNLEYIPCPVEAAADFSQDLTNDEQNDAKNTARWRIRLSNPGAGSKGYYEYDARIGDEWISGPVPPPENLSRNYFWVDTTPPVTEQYQFLGDPRHCPYADVKLEHRYNWYFKHISGDGYDGFDMSHDYWSSGGPWDHKLIIDVPRILYIYRRALQKTNSIWTSIAGWSNFYIGIGSEIRGESNLKAWDPNSSAIATIDEISCSHPSAIMNARLIAADDSSGWYSRTWLGELYPDSQYSIWHDQGNLYTGPTKYYRANYDAVGAAELTIKPNKETGRYGASSFFNGQPSSGGGTFCHTDDDTANGLITTEEKKVAKIFNISLSATIQAYRPFTLNNGGFPPEWNDYSADRTTLSTIEVFYENSANSASYDAAAQIKFENGTGAGYAVVNGLASTGNFGTAQMGKLAIVNTLRGFMNVGLSSIITGRIPQLPRIDLTSPNPNLAYSNPGTIMITWNSQWTRWDGALYTEAYSVGFIETEPIVYIVKYSADNGSTWKYVQNNMPANIGERTNSAYDLTVTSYSWDVSALLKGSYQIRVEAFRPNYPLHYSYHQVLFYLDNL